MAKKITYLWGAGASANAIPVAAQMLDRMKELADCLYEILSKYANAPDKTAIQDFNEDLYHCLGTLNRVYEDLFWLIGQAGNYYSIDTLAKKYFLSNDHKSLARLKKSLIIYFTFEQFVSIPIKNEDKAASSKNRIDKRYGSFLAAITRKNHPTSVGNSDSLTAGNSSFKINKDIKVLNWNYDVQFELTVQEMLTQSIIQQVKREFQIFPNSISKSKMNTSVFNADKFAMVKLNGDANWNVRYGDGMPDIYSILDGVRPRLEIEQYLVDFLGPYNNGSLEKSIADNREIPELSLNFAWELDDNFREKDQGFNKSLDVAEHIAAETQILVVIGYSFPIVNRDIDKRLIEKMGKLEKVYIQDVDPERIKSIMQNAFDISQRDEVVSTTIEYSAEEGVITNSFGIGRLIPFHLEQNTDQFLIPNELTN